MGRRLVTEGPADLATRGGGPAASFAHLLGARDVSAALTRAGGHPVLVVPSCRGR